MESRTAIYEDVVADGGAGALGERPAGHDDELTGRLTDLASRTRGDGTATGVSELLPGTA